MSSHMNYERSWRPFTSCISFSSTLRLHQPSCCAASATFKQCRLWLHQPLLLRCLHFLSPRANNASTVKVRQHNVDWGGKNQTEQNRWRNVDPQDDNEQHSQVDTRSLIFSSDRCSSHCSDFEAIVLANIAESAQKKTKCESVNEPPPRQTLRPRP